MEWAGERSTRSADAIGLWSRGASVIFPTLPHGCFGGYFCGYIAGVRAAESCHFGSAAKKCAVILGGAAVVQGLEGAMKSLKFLFALVAVSFCLISSSARAQNNPLITVDENGVGTILFPGGTPFNTTGVLAPDPGPGGLPLAL